MAVSAACKIQDDATRDSSTQSKPTEPSLAEGMQEVLNAAGSHSRLLTLDLASTMLRFGPLKGCDSTPQLRANMAGMAKDATRCLYLTGVFPTSNQTSKPQISPSATVEGFLRDALILQSSILVLFLIQLLLKLLAKHFMQTATTELSRAVLTISRCATDVFPAPRQRKRSAVEKHALHVQTAMTRPVTRLASLWEFMPEASNVIS